MRANERRAHASLHLNFNTCHSFAYIQGAENPISVLEHVYMNTNIRAWCALCPDESEGNAEGAQEDSSEEYGSRTKGEEQELGLACASLHICSLVSQIKSCIEFFSFV